MAEGIGPIASAVIIPEPEPPRSPPIKRRNSSPSSPSSKRPRLSHDGSSIPLSAAAGSPKAIKAEPQDELKDNSTREKRKSSAQEERKRGQRLFGGLLNTLSQSTPNGQQKRRLEIEKKQLERARAQKVEDEVKLKEMLAGLKAVRKVEQVKFEEEAMRTRHGNMRAMANFLSTKSYPKLYYKPWELLPEQEDRIKVQITEVEEQIEREEDDFYIRHPIQPDDNRERPPPRRKADSVPPKETVGEPRAKSPALRDAEVPVDSTNLPARTAQPEQDIGEKISSEEHNGEVVMENEEDTVIY